MSYCNHLLLLLCECFPRANHVRVLSNTLTNDDQWPF